jgi:SAM-dependent methyltransferase
VTSGLSEPLSAARRLARLVARVPVVGSAARFVWARLSDMAFRDPVSFWEERYAKGGTSGEGSYGRLAEWKAEFLNRFVAERGVASVIEFGCGDGAQLALAEYPRYVGLDVSPSAVARCVARFRGDDSKRFAVLGRDTPQERAELALSLDVVYHLTDDALFAAHLTALFDSAERFVVVYSTDGPLPRSVRQGAHERHRAFTPWVHANRPWWRLTQRVTNPYPPRTPGGPTSAADFFVFERAPDA